MSYRRSRWDMRRDGLLHDRMGYLHAFLWLLDCARSNKVVDVLPYYCSKGATEPALMHAMLGCSPERR